MSGWLFYPIAGFCVATAAALVVGVGRPRHALLFLSCNALGIALLCALLGAIWVGLLQLFLLGVAATALLALASAELDPEPPARETSGFPLVAVLGAGVVIAALLRLAAFVAGLDLPAADLAPGFGRVGALAFWLFADRALIVAGVALLALCALIGSALWLHQETPGGD